MAMDSTEMLRLFEAHREAEAARDIDAILETFVTDCFLETMPLGLRSDGRDAVSRVFGFGAKIPPGGSAAAGLIRKMEPRQPRTRVEMNRLENGPFRDRSFSTPRNVF